MKAIAPIVCIDFVERPVTATIARVEDLAGSLGADLAAPEVTADRARFDRASADVKAAIAEKPGLTALFVYGDADGFYVGNPRQMGDLEYIRELGLDVVQPETTDLWEQLSWEQAAKYPADLILTDARSMGYTAEQLAKVPTWSALPAAKAGQLGSWPTEWVPSHTKFAIILEALAATIRASRADIV